MNTQKGGPGRSQGDPRANPGHQGDTPDFKHYVIKIASNSCLGGCAGIYAKRKSKLMG